MLKTSFEGEATEPLPVVPTDISPIEEVLNALFSCFRAPNQLVGLYLDVNYFLFRLLWIFNGEHSVTTGVALDPPPVKEGVCYLEIRVTGVKRVGEYFFGREDWAG